MAPRPDTRERREALLRDALAIMEAEYPRAIELEDVAQRIATSRRQLQRVFDELHGVPYRTALAQIRMRNAALLLADPQPTTIRSVARRVGYHQGAQFAKAFHRHHGIVPSAYRRAALERAARAEGGGPRQPVPPPAASPA